MEEDIIIDIFELMDFKQISKFEELNFNLLNIILSYLDHLEYLPQFFLSEKIRQKFHKLNFMINKNVMSIFNFLHRLQNFINPSTMDLTTYVNTQVEQKNYKYQKINFLNFIHNTDIIASVKNKFFSILNYPLSDVTNGLLLYFKIYSMSKEIKMNKIKVNIDRKEDLKFFIEFTKNLDKEIFHYYILNVTCNYNETISEKLLIELLKNFKYIYFTEIKGWSCQKIFDLIVGNNLEIVFLGDYEIITPSLMENYAYFPNCIINLDKNFYDLPNSQFLEILNSNSSSIETFEISIRLWYKKLLEFEKIKNNSLKIKFKNLTNLIFENYFSLEEKELFQFFRNNSGIFRKIKSLKFLKEMKSNELQKYNKIIKKFLPNLEEIIFSDKNIFHQKETSRNHNIENFQNITKLQFIIPNFSVSYSFNDFMKFKNLKILNISYSNNNDYVFFQFDKIIKLINLRIFSRIHFELINKILKNNQDNEDIKNSVVICYDNKILNQFLEFLESRRYGLYMLNQIRSLEICFRLTNIPKDELKINYFKNLTYIKILSYHQFNLFNYSQTIDKIYIKELNSIHNLLPLLFNKNLIFLKIDLNNYASELLEYIVNNIHEFWSLNYLDLGSNQIFEVQNENYLNLLEIKLFYLKMNIRFNPEYKEYYYIYLLDNLKKINGVKIING